MAEQALQLALAPGVVNSAECSLRTLQLLTSLPGFKGTAHIVFSQPVAGAVRALDGVSEEVLHEYDEANKFNAMRAYVP